MRDDANAADWSSELVELLRFGDDEVSFDSERPYLIARGTRRARKFETGIRDEEYRRCLGPLRYVEPAPAEVDRRAAIDRLTATVTRILDLEPDARRLQVDLVINAKELAALPFEGANGPDGKPLFVGREPAFELTRRVRGDFRELTPDWPARPNVLFIASSPEQDIPLDQHKQALRRALKPWIEPLEGFPDLDPVVPDPTRVLTICEQATLASVTAVCERADLPFTHVHVLCHGREVAEGEDRQYGLEFSGGPGEGAVGVTAEQLLGALRAGSGQTLPIVVTVTACDSGNVGSRTTSAPSVAHALHTAGIPVVAASQFPLTKKGSTLIVKTLYGSLFDGVDVREAIHRTRTALYENEETKHDWLSLVAYVQLPEGYRDRLLDVRLAGDFAALRTAQDWADHIFKHPKAASTTYEIVATRMKERITSLSKWEEQSERMGRKYLLVESRGLLGSAHKRLAELYFRHARLVTDRDAWLDRSRQALKEATRWYGQAFDDDMSAHWVAVQQLSLDAVVHGRIGAPWRWHAAMHGACGRTTDTTDTIWRLGSKAELHLLAPYAGEPQQVDDAKRALEEFTALIPAGKPEFVESTARQLRRYMSWWTSDNGFFPDAQDLAADAEAVLPADWKL